VITEKNLDRQKLVAERKGKAVDDINSHRPRKIILGEIELNRFLAI